MAVKQPLLPAPRIRDAEVPVVQPDHRGRECGGIPSQLEREPIGPRLPSTRPPQLQGAERKGHKAEEDCEPRQSRDIAGRRNPERGARRIVEPRRDRDDRQGCERALEQPPERIEVALMSELVPEDAPPPPPPP